jgi:hypothetical protein
MDDEIAPPTPRSPISPDTLKSVTALARFEFEPGKNDSGTKILMVEWQDTSEDKARQNTGSWHVSWSGMRIVFKADDKPSDNIRRAYFLIPPGARVPPNVTLAYEPPPGSKATAEAQRMTVYPLPAIFTPELGATASKNGVLHTLWAKKRLQVLEKEIDREQAYNLESIALEMAQAERTWIQETFGLGKPPKLDLSAVPKLGGPASPPLQSPKSPSGRRLSEKLKGLSIGTSERDLRARPNTIINDLHPLSPEVSDVAHSSFSSFRPGPASPRSAAPSIRRIVPQGPPESIRRQQTSSSVASMDFITRPETTEDDLFAIAMSPRSPDIPKSPFSFSSEDIGAFAEIKGQTTSPTTTNQTNP